MPYIVVRNEDGTVLSRASPNALLTWESLRDAGATDYRRAITFETHEGALMCAGMQGGKPFRIDGRKIADVGVFGDPGDWLDRRWRGELPVEVE